MSFMIGNENLALEPDFAFLHKGKIIGLLFVFDN